MTYGPMSATFMDQSKSIKLSLDIYLMPICSVVIERQNEELKDSHDKPYIDTSQLLKLPRSVEQYVVESLDQTKMSDASCRQLLIGGQIEQTLLYQKQRHSLEPSWLTVDESDPLTFAVKVNQEHVLAILDKNDEVRALDVSLILKIGEVYVHAGHLGFAACQSDANDKVVKMRLVVTYTAQTKAVKSDTSDLPQ